MASKLKKPLGDITAATAGSMPVSSVGGGKAAAMGGAGGPASSAGAAASSSGASGKTLEQIYQKVSQREHILLRPDSYIGSNQKHCAALWVWDAGKARIVQQLISYVPGLYKIYDEILVNAADNKQRDKSMTMLKVVVDASTGTISVWNNGAWCLQAVASALGCLSFEIRECSLRTCAGFQSPCFYNLAVLFFVL